VAKKNHNVFPQRAKYGPQLLRRSVGPTPDYVGVLADATSSSPLDLVALVRKAARPLGARQVTLYLADFDRVSLQPVRSRRGSAGPEVRCPDMVSSAAGRSFRTGEPVVEGLEGTIRVWVPVVDRSDRLGVLALRFADPDDLRLAECVSLGLFAGLLVASFARVTDMVHVFRRRQDMALAAGIQWDLLPPLIIRCKEAMACGLLQPAYEMAGDAFDYAVNDPHLDVAIFDGMGHGLHASVLTTLAVGAYRHARRAGADLDQVYLAVDEAVRAEFGDREFVTGILSRLHLSTGVLSWAKAGHPSPLLMRRGCVVGELDCATSLPFGIGTGHCEQVTTEALERGDAVLFFTDGVTEGRLADGVALGTDGLARMWENCAVLALPPEETLRTLSKGVVDYYAGKLCDDATLLLLDWRGAA
jgi:hypothetical protein